MLHVSCLSREASSVRPLSTATVEMGQWVTTALSETMIGRAVSTSAGHLRSDCPATSRCGPPHPGLKSWAGNPCPCGTADRFSAVEEILLRRIRISLGLQGRPAGTRDSSPGFQPWVAERRTTEDQRAWSPNDSETSQLTASPCLAQGWFSIRTPVPSRIKWMRLSRASSNSGSAEARTSGAWVVAII